MYLPILFEPAPADLKYLVSLFVSQGEGLAYSLESGYFTNWLVKLTG